MMRPEHSLTSAERDLLVMHRSRVYAAMQRLEETIRFGLTTAEVRLAAATLSHAIRRLHGALDGIEQEGEGHARD